MIFSWDLLVPAGTSESQPKVVKLRLTEGFIHKVSVLFPNGCAGCVKLRLMDRQMPIVPKNVGEWLVGNDETIEFPEYYVLKPPYEIEAHLVNEGSYDHKLQVRLGVFSPKDIEALRQMPVALI